MVIMVGMTLMAMVVILLSGGSDSREIGAIPKSGPEHAGHVASDP